VRREFKYSLHRSILGVVLPFCSYCGSETTEDDRFCRNCGGAIEGRGETGAEVIPAKASSQPNAWVPILWLVAILLGSLVFWLAGPVLLVIATIWVYFDSKKRGVGGSPWLVTLLFAIVGLPMYAYELHKVRKTMLHQKHGIEGATPTPQGIAGHTVISKAVTGVKCSCGRPTPHLHYSRLHEIVTGWGLILIVLLWALAFVTGFVQGATRLYLSYYEIDAYRAMGEWIERLTLPYKPLSYMATFLDILVLVLVVVSVATLRSVRHRGLHDVAVVSSPVLLLGEISLLTYHEMLTGQALLQLRDMMSLSTLETALRVQEKFNNAYGFWASPTYGGIRLIMVLSTLILLFVAAFTARKPAIWDVQASAIGVAQPSIVPRVVVEPRQGIPCETIVAKTFERLRKVAVAAIVVTALSLTMFYAWWYVPFLPVVVTDSRTATSTTTHSSVVTTDMYLVRTTSTISLSTSTRMAKEEEYIIVVSITAQTTLTQRYTTYTTVLLTDLITVTTSVEATRHKTLADTYPMLHLLLVAVIVAISVVMFGRGLRSTRQTRISSIS